VSVEPSLLSFDNVHYRWPRADREVLDVPALHLAAGERVLLSGESGGGKSTLLSLAAGVLLPQQGSVRLLGQDWRALRAGARDQRRVDHVGYIFQQFNLLPYLSAIDNVLLPCRFSRRRRERAVAAGGSPRSVAESLLSALGLDAASGQRKAAALSVGQQQRVAAARALIGQPELVIADEPTSALDEARRDTFMALLTALCAQHGLTLLFVSHDLRLATHFERVVALSDLNLAATQVAPES